MFVPKEHVGNTLEGSGSTENVGECRSNSNKEIYVRHDLKLFPPSLNFHHIFNAL